MRDTVTLYKDVWTNENGQRIKGTPVTRVVPCIVDGVDGRERRVAAGEGHSLSITMKMPAVNYKGEETCSYRSKKYNVYSANYEDDMKTVVLQLEERVGVTNV